MVNILQMTFSNPSMHHDTPIITFLHNLTSIISENHTAQKILVCVFIQRPPTKWPAFCIGNYIFRTIFLQENFGILIQICCFCCVSWMDSITVVSHAHRRVINHWQLNFVLSVWYFWPCYSQKNAPERVCWGDVPSPEVHSGLQCKLCHEFPIRHRHNFNGVSTLCRL